ncbi:MAG: ABC transporter ATP-binding protein [Chloroflexi bacterium]|nr:ABC transporter ATP-binding protein [Chloroflexota bacterium]
MTVRKGEIFGFLGPNGAGKTTTIRLLLDLIRPTGGQALVFGLDCQRRSQEVRERVGYLPGELNLYQNTHGRRLLEMFGSLRQGQVPWDYVHGLCQRLKVDLETPVGHMSHGNRQKVGLTLALMARPDLLILDEPTTGLDPLVQRQVMEVLREASAQGATVFFSSHVLPEVEQICDRVGFIRQGRLIAVEEVTSLHRRRLQRLTISFATTIPADAFASLPGVRLLQGTDRMVQLEVTGDIDPVVKVAARYPIASLDTERPTLEEEFLAYYRGEGLEARP